MFASAQLVQQVRVGSVLLLVVNNDCVSAVNDDCLGLGVTDRGQFRFGVPPPPVSSTAFKSVLQVTKRGFMFRSRRTAASHGEQVRQGGAEMLAMAMNMKLVMLLVPAGICHS